MRKEAILEFDDNEWNIFNEMMEMIFNFKRERCPGTGAAFFLKVCRHFIHGKQREKNEYLASTGKQ